MIVSLLLSTRFFYFLATEKKYCGWIKCNNWIVVIRFGNNNKVSRVSGGVSFKIKLSNVIKVTCVFLKSLLKDMEFNFKGSSIHGIIAFHIDPIFFKYIYIYTSIQGCREMGGGGGRGVPANLPPSTPFPVANIFFSTLNRKK